MLPGLNDVIETVNKKVQPVNCTQKEILINQRKSKVMNNNEITKQDLTVKSLFNRDDVKQKFQELLGKRASSFITSVLQIAASSNQLSKADPYSIYNAAAVAATMDLPLNNNLGFAYIVPYNQKQPDNTWKQVAQFQMGYKGFIQLAQRSGQFQTLNSTDVREGEIKSFDRLTGAIEFEWVTEKRLEKPIVGFVAYFKLLNGFEKSHYMTVDELRKHGSRYSKTFTIKSGLWNTDFEAMASKTVVKLLLAKYAPLSIEMQRAVIADQGLINDTEATDVTYLDNEPVEINKEAERVALMIQDAKTAEELDAIYEHVQDGQMDMFLNKKESLSKEK